MGETARRNEEEAASQENGDTVDFWRGKLRIWMKERKEERHRETKGDRFLPPFYVPLLPYLFTFLLYFSFAASFLLFHIIIVSSPRKDLCS